ncbi:MAG: glycosyltransferase family 4 protein [Nostoc sp. TH1S01]|nr:glycosyltransferase family 4 protein [Nostoc sp. TH1S01]
MKPLLINTSDIIGGSSRAAYRLHKGLQQIGVNSQMLVQEKSSDDSSIIAPPVRFYQGIARSKISIDAFPLKYYQNSTRETFSLQWLPDRVINKVNKINPDIINLHWICGGFLQIETLSKLKRPVVWTMHDMWPFTGGCHYSGECDRYTKYCGACHYLGSTQELDISRWVWKRKAKAWRKVNLTIVTPSHWLAKCARSSSLFHNLPIEVIPNGIDISIYQPIERQLARKLLKLPQNKKIILFGALKADSNKRKGFNLLISALQKLNETVWKDNLEVAIFGASKPGTLPRFGFKSHYLGTFQDDISLALVYSMADVFVLPSVQENLANTVMESLACGTPCVAFNIGGTSDMIDHLINGYLAHPYEIEDLAQGISWILENQERYKKLSYQALEKAKSFTQEIQARRYLSLFKNLKNYKES